MLTRLKTADSEPIASRVVTRAAHEALKEACIRAVFRIEPDGATARRPSASA